MVGKQKSLNSRKGRSSWLGIGSTTIGLEGTPSGRNVGPARLGNPAESGRHWLLAILDCFSLSELRTCTSHDWDLTTEEVFRLQDASGTKEPERESWAPRLSLNVQLMVHILSFSFTWPPITTSYACFLRGAKWCSNPLNSRVNNSEWKGKFRGNLQK